MKIRGRSTPFRPLVACIALALGAADAGAVPLHAAFVVQNCLDSGPGSLRQAVIDDIAGEPIDLTQMACSRITLTSGSINVQRALLINGPGAAIFTIDGAGLDRVFIQTSADPLALYGMSIENGYASSFGGGCVYAAGSLQLNDTIVRNCRVSDIAGSSTSKGGGLLVHGTLIAVRSSIADNEIYSALGSAIGGGAAVDGSVILDRSAVSGNVVSSATSASVGGIAVGAQLAMMDSTVANNLATGSPYVPVVIGGLIARMGATITGSTISGNSSSGSFGGLVIYGSPGEPNVIVQSTISGNSSTGKGDLWGIGGVDAHGDTSIINSTIAFNVSRAGIGNGVGLRIADVSAHVESSIIALNGSDDGATEQDIGLGTGGSVTGTHNLIGPSPSVMLPPDTIGGDPLLLPLSDNGGWTKTHALRAGSPAENAGEDNGYDTDQRGAGFPRVVGPSADIGAFEGVDPDSIFYDGFD